MKTFVGFKGKMAAAQIGDIRFVILAQNSKQLAILWSHIMANAAPLDPAGIKSAILIEAATLPETRQGTATGAAVVNGGHLVAIPQGESWYPPERTSSGQAKSSEI